MPARLESALALLAALVVAACTGAARLPFSAGVGPDPQLPPPEKELIPTVNIAKARGWAEGAKPTAAPGLTVTAFATGLSHPRWIHVLPNGDVLVAETNAPPRPEEGKGLKAKVMGMVMKRAGAAVPSANRITLLRDANGDGVPETRTVFIENLNSPFGMASSATTSTWRTPMPWCASRICRARPASMPRGRA